MSYLKTIASWIFVRPAKFIMSVLVFAGVLAAIIQGYYSLFDHHFKLMPSTISQQSTELLPTSPKIPFIDQNKIVESPSVKNNPLHDQIDDLKAYVKDSLARKNLMNDSSKGPTSLVLARPPFLNVQNGVGYCLIRASIVSGDRTLVFQNNFEGLSSLANNNNPEYLRTEACHHAVDKMLEELGP